MKKGFYGFNWAVLVLCPLVVFLALLQTISQFNQVKTLQEEANRLEAKAFRLQQIKQRESATLAPLKNFDPHYLDKYVETLSFLTPEIKKLEALCHNLEDEALFKRLQHLKSSQNRLIFSEERIRSNELFREIEEQQQFSVEMNEEDLKRLLCLIEGTTIWPYGPKEGRPLFLITDFKLSKKDLVGKEKVFVVSMNLLKREGV